MEEGTECRWDHFSYCSRTSNVGVLPSSRQRKNVPDTIARVLGDIEGLRDLQKLWLEYVGPPIVPKDTSWSSESQSEWWWIGTRIIIPKRADASSLKRDGV